MMFPVVFKDVIETRSMSINNYIVELQIIDDELNVWMYEQDMGYKMFLFGVDKKYVDNEQDLFSMIMCDFEQSIKLYNEDIKKLERD